MGLLGFATGSSDTLIMEQHTGDKGPLNHHFGQGSCHDFLGPGLTA